MNLESLNKDRNRRKLDTSGIYGKIPPQAKEIEEVVLGAIMIDKRAFDTVAEILRPECFYVESHKLIYQAMVKLNQRSQVIEIFSVVEELMKMESLDIVGGPYYVTKLTNSVVSTAALEQHARIVLEKYMKREIIRIGMEMIGDGYEDSTDVFELLDKSENSVFAIGNSFLKKDFQKLQEVGAKVVTRIDKLRASDEIISGVPSGFKDLDRITNGWQDTDLIILAARPSVGKTAFALNLARNAAKNIIKKTPVGFFSLEMSAEQLVQRLLSAESEVFMSKISQGKMDEQDYLTIMNKGIKKFDSMDIYIDDSAALNIFEFRAKARRMVQKHKVGLIIIDYLQLMSGIKDRNGNREQEISTISRNLKALAKELGVPIIALSQLSRDVEKRGGSKVPQLSDLRESGAIEQDADMVMFLYRKDSEGTVVTDLEQSGDGWTETKIAKHRNGSLGVVKFTANLAIQRFGDYEEGSQVPGYKPMKDFDDDWTKPL
jgi:replicative DNA helicase